MDEKIIRERILQYNKTIHGMTKLEKQMVKEANRQYSHLHFYYAITTGIEKNVETFIKANKEFKALLNGNSDSLLYYLRNIQNYTCNASTVRMDIRSSDFSTYRTKVLEAIGAFYIFQASNLSIKELIYGEYRNLPTYYQLHCIITAELLKDNREVIQYCKDVLVSENNTAVLTRDVIIAIEQSNNKELQDLLTQVFLAAKLQEGLRQAVVETVDENNIYYFIEIMKVIEEENLLRFSSVQRGVMTWIGIGYQEAKEKDIRNILQMIRTYMTNEESRKQGLESDNPLSVYLSLYAKGVFSLEKATKEALLLLNRKERHIVASALVYLKLTGQFNIIDNSYLLETFEDDEWIQALYLSECNTYLIEKMKISKDEANTLMIGFSKCLPKLKATQTYNSKGFEWFSVSVNKFQIATCMCLILKKNPSKENVNLFIPYMEIGLRSDYMDEFMIMHFDKASSELKMNAMEKGITSTNRQLAEKIAKKYKKKNLSDEEILRLEKKLTIKKSYNRALIIDVFSKQNRGTIKEVYERLSNSSNETLKNAAIELKSKAPQILGESETVKLLGRNDGYGLYTPKRIYELPYKDKLIKTKKGFLKKKEVVDLDSIFVWNKEQVINYIKKWSSRIINHENDEYYNGREYCQIKNSMFSFVLNYKSNTLDSLAFPEVWRSYFDEDRLSDDVLYELNLVLSKHLDHKMENEFSINSSFFSIVNSDTSSIPYIRQIETIITRFYNEKKLKDNNKTYMLIQFINEYLSKREFKQQYFRNDKRIISMGTVTRIYSSEFLSFQDSDEEFKDKFPLEYNSYINFNVKCSNNATSKYTIHPYNIARAVHLNMLPREVLYESILNTYNEGDYGYYSGDTQFRVAYLISYFQNNYQKKTPVFDLNNYTVNDKEVDKEVILLLRESLVVIIDTLLAIEHQRINEETDATRYIGINSVYPGIKYLIFALNELEHEKITRSTIDTYGKNAVFISVIKNSYILDSDDIQDLIDANVKEERLVEVAMLAPQWIDTVNELLGWDGFKDACYYFIAHMKHYNYEQKKAEIAHYTSLEPQDLNDGAFDGDWCKEIYNSLGEKRFKIIYNAAKFLCDNSFHSRARKYADACLGKLDKKVLLEQINDKRNKDSLNAYCVMEIKNDKELLERYLVIQKFAKESKKYGSQRQSSEKRSCEIAMLNLARNSRFKTVTRLSWFLESEMISHNADALKPQLVDDVEIWIEIDENGKNEIKVRKNDKTQKTIPAKLRKHSSVLRLKEVHKSWSEQYKRSRKMLEKAMEERTVFDKDEIAMIISNPVVAPIMKKLVLKSNNGFGFYNNGQLINRDETTNIKEEVYIAHPYDLYQAGVWQDYQTYIFENEMIQPFKQVFRELYLKLDDELGLDHTKRYTGYQIQTKKAAATLKSRGWNVSYENGLERVYYKENLVVNMYANADWFSPSDIEAPSIDYVTFQRRTSGERVQIKEIDDVLFSEVMRDVDLAVSTAHVGGVDPVTSFSTIELRRTIVKYTAQLMKLNNIEVQDNFANIKGTLNEYSVHLGSGVVHQSGGAAIHIISVFSGKRGKVYLPFLDEDPKSAEIISKIVMFAEDNKIKDPSILEQIRMNSRVNG